MLAPRRNPRCGRGARSRCNEATKERPLPSKWPGNEWGWLLQICYDGNGKIIDSQTICINEKLMYDGKNDPRALSHK